MIDVNVTLSRDRNKLFCHPRDKRVIGRPRPSSETPDESTAHEGPSARIFAPFYLCAVADSVHWIVLILWVVTTEPLSPSTSKLGQFNKITVTTTTGCLLVTSGRPRVDQGGAPVAKL